MKVMHCKYGCNFITHIDTSQSISFMRVALWTFGKGYSLPWNGFAPSFNWMETGSKFHSPKVPSNNCSNLNKSKSSNSLCDGVRCLQLSSTMAERSALAYLASRISTTHLVAAYVLAGSWLSKACILLQRPRDARFLLQIIDIPHGQEDLIYGNCF